MRRRLGGALAAGLVASAGSPATAVAAALQESDSAATIAADAATSREAAAVDARAAEIAAELRCLVCRGQSVLESSSELARQMHALIREQVAEGKSEEEIKAYFVSRYGEWVLLQPPARGVNLLVYGLPLAAIVGGAIFLRGRFRRWTGGGEGADAEPAEFSERDEEWLREELRKV
ncbi:MAG: cytochrome c-type biogenesis protein CcmH [Gemmatimonadota bacterium]